MQFQLLRAFLQNEGNLCGELKRLDCTAISVTLVCCTYIHENGEGKLRGLPYMTSALGGGLEKQTEDASSVREVA